MMTLLRRSTRANMARRLFAPPAALLVFALMLSGCGLFGGDAAQQAQPTPTAISSAPSTDGPTAPVRVGGQVVVPGMPNCDSQATPCPTPSGDATGLATVMVPTAVGQPVVQPPTGVMTPFVVYAKGQLAPGGSDASDGGTKAEYASREAVHDGHPAIKVTHASGWGSFSVADWNNSNVPELTKYTH